ncbi:MAG: TIR domain-containing protein [Mollicutes bacterium PWAP]|nr:TIR domain-containing protein [Mollicutes bacterium PWAP]
MIFISYSRKDSLLASDIIIQIEKEFSEDVFFIDIKDIEIGNINFINKIDENLSKAEIFIPIITNNYLDSEICKLEMNAFFLSMMSESFKKIIPYYPKNIIDKTPLIYRGINSLIEVPIEEIVSTIKLIKEGKAITKLKSPLEGNFKANSFYSNGVALNFLYFNNHFSNPRIEIHLNETFDWKKHFGSYKNVWNNLKINWEGKIMISGVNEDKPIANIGLSGVYFAGANEEITISLPTDIKEMKEFFNDSLLVNIGINGKIYEKGSLFKKIKILQNKKNISEIIFY